MALIVAAKSRTPYATNVLCLASALFAACSPFATSEPTEHTQRALTTAPTVVSLTFDDGPADQLIGADLLAAHAMRGSFYIVSNRIRSEGSLSVEQLLALQTAGHEIGSHTMGHVDLVTIDEAARLRQLCQSRYDLMAEGLVITSFAYPFGSPRRDSPELPGIEAMLQECGYNSARGSGDLHTSSSCNTCPRAESIPPTDPFHLKSISSIPSTVTLDTLQGYVAQAEQSGGGWVPLVLHHVCDGCASNAIAPALLSEFLDWLSGEVASGAVTVSTVADMIGGAVRPPVAAPPPEEPPFGSNLLKNPSLELDRNEDHVPDCWQRGGSGTSTVSYSLTSVAHSGSVAQQIDVTDFVSGARRLVALQDATTCAPAAHPGHVYEVSAWYTATAASRFTAYILDSNNSWVYLAQSPLLSPMSSYTQAFWTLPPLPAGAQALSVGLTLVANGQLRMDDFDLHDSSQLTHPIVSIVRPITGGIARGTVTVAATASDADGIDRVELLVDGVLVGGMVAAADGSFILSWDSKLHAEGSASLQARAYDVLGGVGTATIAVTVANAPGANLLPNPSLELDLNQDDIPDCWRRGGSGASTVSYSLTPVAHSGNIAQQIDVSDFVSGARRLLVSGDAGICAPLTQPGHVYQVSAWYTATAASRFTAYIVDSNNNLVYLAQSALLPPVSSYTQASWTIPALPAGAQALSVGLTLVANGQLRMDDFDLHDSTELTPPTVSILRPLTGGIARGTVMVGAAASDADGIGNVELLVDGVLVGRMEMAGDGSFGLAWDSSLHQDGSASLTARAYDVLGNAGTATVAVTVANAPGANLLPNPSLEQDLNQDKTPDCWRYGGSGTSTVSYSLTSVAHSGNVAQQIDVADFVSGARRLLVKQEAGTCAPLVLPGHEYAVSAWYTATAASRFTAYVLDSNNSWVYLAQSSLLSPVSSYTQAFWTIPALPAGSQALSVGLALVANGQLRMDDFDLHDFTELTAAGVVLGR